MNLLRNSGLVATFVSVTLLLGCSSSDKKPNAQVRDVPTQARESRTEEPRKRVLVLPFIDVSSQRGEAVANSARSGLLRGLNLTKAFVVVENSDFPKDPKSFRTNDQYDLEPIAKLAAGMGISLVIEGRVLEIRAKRLGDQVGLMRKVRAQMDAKIQIRVVGAKTNRELMNEVREATIETTTTKFGTYAYSDKFLEEDPELVEQVVQKAVRSTIPNIVAVARKISWEGKIAMVSGDRIYVNAGRLSGLQVGDILRVNDEGNEVFDPENGVFIGRAPGRMKGTLEVVSYFGKDGTIAVIHSGSGFKENDQVEFY